MTTFQRAARAALVARIDYLKGVVADIKWGKTTRNQAATLRTQAEGQLRQMDAMPA